MEHIVWRKTLKFWNLLRNPFYGFETIKIPARRILKRVNMLELFSKVTQSWRVAHTYNKRNFMTNKKVFRLSECQYF